MEQRLMREIARAHARSMRVAPILSQNKSSCVFDFFARSVPGKKSEIVQTFARGFIAPICLRHVDALGNAALPTTTFGVDKK